MISVSLKLAAAKGIHLDNDTIDPAEGIPALAAAEDERTVKWEAVLLLGDERVITAARAWHHSVFRLRRAASGLPIEMTCSEAIQAVSAARRQFYEAAKQDLGINIGSDSESYEWQLAKLASLQISDTSNGAVDKPVVRKSDAPMYYIPRS
ncbi:hypothetical protein AB0K14_30305 [Actinosynnema sp. NPDC050801]|uniref:hypothetical protein n=1 Tax=unclassified Actinosynnema TaxID=2637065 RepID=UPI0033DCFB96